MMSHLSSQELRPGRSQNMMRCSRDVAGRWVRNSVPLSEILYWLVCEEGSLCCTRVELNTPKLSVFKDEDLLKDLYGKPFYNNVHDSDLKQKDGTAECY